jgi:hypothetical protein
MELRDGCYVLPWDDTDEGFSDMAETTLGVIAMCMILQESHQFFMDTHD